MRADPSDQCVTRAKSGGTSSGKEAALWQTIRNKRCGRILLPGYVAESRLAIRRREQLLKDLPALAEHNTPDPASTLVDNDRLIRDMAAHV